MGEFVNSAEILEIYKLCGNRGNKQYAYWIRGWTHLLLRNVSASSFRTTPLYGCRRLDFIKPV